MAALEAGLYVYCEKPRAYTASEAREKLARAEAIGVKHMLVKHMLVKHMLTFTHRCLPHFQALKRLLDDGYIGRPFHAHCYWPTGWGRNLEDR